MNYINARSPYYISFGEVMSDPQFKGQPDGWSLSGDSELFVKAGKLVLKGADTSHLPVAIKEINVLENTDYKIEYQITEGQSDIYITTSGDYSTWALNILDTVATFNRGTGSKVFNTGNNTTLYVVIRGRISLDGGEAAYSYLSIKPDSIQSVTLKLFVENYDFGGKELLFADTQGILTNDNFDTTNNWNTSGSSNLQVGYANIYSVAGENAGINQTGVTEVDGVYFLSINGYIQPDSDNDNLTVLSTDQAPINLSTGHGTTVFQATSTTFELKRYSGSGSTHISVDQLRLREIAPDYTLTATPINGEVTFEIADLLRDYLEEHFEGDYPSKALRVYGLLSTVDDNDVEDVKTLQHYTVFDGYSYGEEGINADTTGYKNESYNLLPSEKISTNTGWTANNITISDFISENIAYPYSSYSATEAVDNSTSESIIYRNLIVNSEEGFIPGQRYTISVDFVGNYGTGNVGFGIRLIGVTEGGEFSNGGTSIDQRVVFNRFSSELITEQTGTELGLKFEGITDLGTFGPNNYEWKRVAVSFNWPSEIIQSNGDYIQVRLQPTTFNASGVFANADTNSNVLLGDVKLTKGEQGPTKTSPEAGIMLSTPYLFTTGDNHMTIPVNNVRYERRITKKFQSGSEVVIYTGLGGELDADDWSRSDYNAIKYLEIEDTVSEVFDPPYVFKVHNLDAGCNTPYKLTFVNKYGAYEDLWMVGNTKETIDLTSESYRGTFSNPINRSISTHQYKTLRKQGKVNLEMNSGFYPEVANEAFQQMLLSESVWINYNGQSLPVMIKDTSMNFKTHKTDKLINYTLNVEFAYDKINNIR